jgi:hypothetical protein
MTDQYPEPSPSDEIIDQSASLEPDKPTTDVPSEYLSSADAPSDDMPPQTPLYSSAPPSQPIYYSTPARPHKDKGLAMILEIVPALFGIFGIGWIYSGNLNTGLIWLIGMLLWTFFTIFLDVITFGVACLCTVPIQLIMIIVTAVTLNTHINKHPEVFGN